jgi:hypothetical protein
LYDLPDWHAMRPSERRELALRLGQNLVSLGEFIEEVAPWEAMKANGHLPPPLKAGRGALQTRR